MTRNESPGASRAWEAWEAPASPVARVALRFGQETSRKTLNNFSAGTRVEDTLFLAADEGVDLDRLAIGADGCGEHACIHLGELLPLADADEEADIEGLAADHGWLWVVGSHARTRAKPDKRPGASIDLDELADLNDTRARCLLARLPLVRFEAGWTPAARDGDRRAGLLQQGKKGNAIARALRDHPLTRPFTRIPAKEGGVDVEGIAVCGDRVALGMRGPVIATHALLIELKIEVKPSGKLKLDGEPMLRLLAMEGLGVRDLKRHGRDLLILAGPTTGLDGPCALYRWRGWADDPARDAQVVRLHRPERVLDLPFGRGEDHPEGLALWDDGARVLVINDSPAASRADLDGRTVWADLFDLPA